MKNIKIFYFASILFLVSCEDFLEINVDPNYPSQPAINQLLPGILYDLADDLSVGFGKLGYATSVFTHQLTTREPEYDQYGVTGSSYAIQTYWKDLYAGVVPDIDLLIELGSDEVTQNYMYRGIGKILKAYTYSIIVDLWGDVPFSEANQKSLNTSPKFDNDEIIYPALFVLLNEGIADLQNEEAVNATEPGGDDLIYGGNASQWIKTANTIKLKLYNQVRLTPLYNQAEVDALIAGDLIEEGDDFMVPFGTKNSPEERHPAFVSEYGGAQISNYISPWLYEIMNGLNPSILTDVVDPRIPYYWVNQLSGNDPENPAEYKVGDFNSTYFGSVGPNRDHAGRASFTMMGIYIVGGKYDDGTGGGPLGVDDGTGAVPQRLLTYADRLFIEAELRQVGLVTGDAREKLEEAIIAAFAQVDMVVGLSETSQNVPLLSESEEVLTYDSLVLAEYDGAGAEKQLEIVMTQKWLSSFGSSIDQYTDYRRTGYPVLFDPNSNGGLQSGGPDGSGPVPTQLTRGYPLSLPYDNDEITSNLNLNQQKVITTDRVFWDVN